MDNKCFPASRWGRPPFCRVPPETKGWGGRPGLNRTRRGGVPSRSVLPSLDPSRPIHVRSPSCTARVTIGTVGPPTSHWFRSHRRPRPSHARPPALLPWSSTHPPSPTHYPTSTTPRKYRPTWSLARASLPRRFLLNEPGRAPDARLPRTVRVSDGSPRDKVFIPPIQLVRLHHLDASSVRVDARNPD
jgi:hypothetical protein